MRAALIALAALVVSGGVVACPALGADPGLTGREAAIAVREEVGNNWVLLGTVPRRPESRATTVSVDCAGVSPRRRLCAWEAVNAERGQVADGLAVVVDHPGSSATARLYAYDCKARAELSCV